jgi:hypothetical protein
MGKIEAINDDERKALLLELTDKFNIYSLGRYAIWKDSVGADAVAHDLERIYQMISVSQERRKYDNHLA